MILPSLDKDIIAEMQAECELWGMKGLVKLPMAEKLYKG